METAISKWQELAGPDREAHRHVFSTLCERYGLDPDPEVRPREVAAVRAGGNQDFLETPYVVAVTAGGIKLREPMDEDTEERLRRLFKCFQTRWNARTKQDEVIILPLPVDLRLSPELRTGIPTKKAGRT